MLTPRHRPAIVINVTPDSNFCHKAFVYQSFSELIDLYQKKYPGSIIDIGAESTSPLNQPITEEEEIRRLDSTLGRFLKERGEWPSELTLSIDTYRAKTIRHVLEIVETDGQTVIWNDVSGHYHDPDVLSILNQFSSLHYVIGHNPAPARDLAGCHLIYAKREESGERVLENLILFFEKLTSYFKEHGMLERTLFDPCFSFGKTQEQSLFLALQLERIVTHFSQNQQWMIGASRKSFLRKHLEIGREPVDESLLLRQMEEAHLKFLTDWRQKLKDYPILFRIHDPEIFFQ